MKTDAFVVKGVAKFKRRLLSHQRGSPLIYGYVGHVGWLPWLFWQEGGRGGIALLLVPRLFGAELPTRG